MNGDFGSSFAPWMREKARPKSLHIDHKSASYINLVQKSKLEEVRREFLLNGFDSPYNPDDIWTKPAQPREYSGMGPAVYLRQKSWPAPDSSPAARLPRPRSIGDTNFATSTPIFDDVPPFTPDVCGSEQARREMLGVEQARRELINADQARVLNSLPDNVLYNLLRGLSHERRYKPPKECRFCKNNGERVSFCVTHVLKDEYGRVSCPVLRAFTCRRCGASGDTAHTIKYCPLTTSEERNISQGMMRSIRKSSVRRRYPATPVQQVTPHGDSMSPLEPSWAALEEKLSHFTLDGPAYNHNFVYSL